MAALEASRFAVSDDAMAWYLGGTGDLAGSVVVDRGVGFDAGPAQEASASTAKARDATLRHPWGMAGG